MPGGIVRGSVVNSTLNSYNNSSDESVRGGSTNSLRGRQLKSKAHHGKNGVEIRNHSSDYHHYSSRVIENYVIGKGTQTSGCLTNDSEEEQKECLNSPESQA